MQALERAIQIVGGTYALADKLGCRQSRISMWVTRGQVPPEHCRAIEMAVSGAVTRYELRPDVFGEAPDGMALATAAEAAPQSADPARVI